MGRREESLIPSSFPGLGFPPKARVAQSSGEISECHHWLWKQLCDVQKGDSFLCFTEEADGGLVLGFPTTLPAAQLLFCGSPLSAITSHWPIFISFCSLLPFSLAGAFTFSPPNLLLLVFFLIHYYYLFLRSQLLCDLLHRVRCFHTRLF